MHLADGGVHRDQHPVTATEVRHVPDQHQCTGCLALFQQWDAAQEDDHVRASFDFLGHRLARREGDVDRLPVDAQLVEPHPLGVGVHAHSVESVDRVG